MEEVGVQDTHRTGARQYNQRMAQANSFMYQGRVARGSVGKGSLISGIGGALGSGLSATGNVIMSAGSAGKVISKIPRRPDRASVQLSCGDRR